MERTRIAKVDKVKLVRRGQQVEGALHLTPHHLIFSHSPPQGKDGNTSQDDAPPRPKELWITYPIIQTCTLRFASPASHHPSSIRLRCRDFTYVCFCFSDDKQARDAYDSIRAWTCKIGKVEKLYAFTYQPQRPEKDVDGWSLYDPRAEFKRQGISEKGTEKGWRISNINKDYSFSPTYPSVLAVPSVISDNTLNYASKYRSRHRLPVLTYLHPVNDCSITRCSQPLVGVRQNRSIQDEKLLLAIFSTSTSKPSSLDPVPTPPGSQTPRTSEGDAPSLTPETSFTDTEALEDELIAQSGVVENGERPHVYGAQQHNLIVDARPTVNAYATQAMGMGTENMDNYPFATKAYLGIENIHVMRDSLSKVIDALKDSDVTSLPPNRDILQKSSWLKHIANMLDGVGLIARQVGLQHSHVLIHCSDGWDRTSQLSALSQLCLDPYFRTLEGFIVLVEKDWLSFGHMFAHRAGHLSSEKWFQIENDRPGTDSNGVGINNKATNALENAFLSARGFFNKENNKSRDSLVDSDTEVNPLDPSASRRSPAPKGSTAPDTKHATKVKETSPIFHQFLDATYQLQQQHPTRFEFNERFLRRLLYHVYSCQYGNFLYNNERERRDARVPERTRSVWAYFLARRDQFLNPRYDAVVDDNARGRERLLFPVPARVRWWHELFGRTDDEMNAPVAPTASVSVGSSAQSQRSPNAAGRPRTSDEGPAEEHHMALTGVETADTKIVAGSAPTSPRRSPRLSATAVPRARSRSPMERHHLASPTQPVVATGATDRLRALGASVAALGLGSDVKGKGERHSDGGVDREMSDLGSTPKQMEIEMQ